MLSETQFPALTCRRRVGGLGLGLNLLLNACAGDSPSQAPEREVQLMSSREPTPTPESEATPAEGSGHEGAHPGGQLPDGARDEQPQGEIAELDGMPILRGKQTAPMPVQPGKQTVPVPNPGAPEPE